jgi:hypothetical protein
LRRWLALTVAVVCTGMVMLSAALLAYAQGPTRIEGWLLPRDLSESGDAASRGPRIVADDEGHIHVIWTDDSEGQPDPHYVKSVDYGTNWTTISRIATGRPSHDAALDVDDDGYVHAAWWDLLAGTEREFEVMYARRAGTTWSMQATDVITQSDIKGPSIAVTADYIHIVWSNKEAAQAYDLWYIRRARSAGSWSEPRIVVDTGPGSLYGRMAADAYGNLHVAWQEDKATDEIMYITGTVEAGQTTWHTPMTLTEALTPTATSPDIAIGADDVVHIVFGLDVPGLEHTQDIYHVSFSISNTEGFSPTIIPDSRVFVTQQLPNYASPALALEGANTIHVVWNGVREDDLWDRIYYATSRDGGENWSRAVPVSPDDAWPDGFPDVAGSAGLAHVVWQQETSGSDNDVYYSHSLPWVQGLVVLMKEYE